MLRPNDTYHKNDASRPDERNQSTTHQSSALTDETETTQDTSVGAAVRESVGEITGAPTTLSAAMHRPQEMESQKKERSGSKRKKRSDPSSDSYVNPNPSVGISSATQNELGSFDPGISAARQQLIRMQLLERHQQQQQQQLLRQHIHHSDTVSRGLMGPSVSTVLNQIHRSQQQQGLQLPSLQQTSLESFMASNRSLRQQLTAGTNLNQEQQYQLLLEHHAQQQQQQQQRDRWNIEQATSQSQFAHLTQSQAEAAIAAATNMPLLLNQSNLLNTDRLPNAPQPDWMNYREQLSSIGFPSINRNALLQLPLQQLVVPPIHPLHPSLNYDRTAELRQLLLANQRTEQIPFHQMVGGSTSLGENFANSNNLLSRTTASSMAWGQNEAFGSVGTLFLPASLARAEDAEKLSPHQVLLRNQIETFQATSDDVSTHTRGRNKPIGLNQVGIRCRHCAHLPVSKRRKGSTYFPATILGIYQAAQNMSTTHIQSGLCSEMPIDLKQQFETLQNLKVASSGAGRPYWADSAKQLGLVDTEDGIQFIRSLRIGTRILLESENKADDGRAN